MVRSQYSETSQQVFVGPLCVQRLFLLEREKSLGPQDQQRPVESNWVWNINFPFGKRRNLHFWTIDSLPSRWPWLLTWNSFYFDEVHICLSFWVYLDLPELTLPPATPIQPVGHWVGWLDLWAVHSFFKGRDTDGISQNPSPSVSCAESLQSCLTFCDPMDFSPPGSSAHGLSPGKNTGVGCPTLLQGTFPIQG